jgi:hypothetical protein
VIPVDGDIGPDKLPVLASNFEALDFTSVGSLQAVGVAEAEANAVILFLVATIDWDR